ncbi:hypothetical protein CPLU01_06941 [Colletotrichum plurivorum]|uniref:Uncharacterized protein n=1 Tax=Colletotrichum plurivorum TaxID=2175906 RepID=A0A8H6KH29_9PEZI|nr:hypothetical protein CPLU01_06941 [Colletotrichum plurivorum]
MAPILGTRLSLTAPPTSLALSRSPTSPSTPGDASRPASSPDHPKLVGRAGFRPPPRLFSQPTALAGCPGMRHTGQNCATPKLEPRDVARLHHPGLPCRPPSLIRPITARIMLLLPTSMAARLSAPDGARRSDFKDTRLFASSSVIHHDIRNHIRAAAPY